MYVWTTCSKTVFFTIFWWFLQVNLNTFFRYVSCTCISRSISNKSFIVDTKSRFLSLILSWNLLVENSCDSWIFLKEKSSRLWVKQRDFLKKIAKGKNYGIILLFWSCHVVLIARLISVCITVKITNVFIKKNLTLKYLAVIAL